MCFRLVVRLLWCAPSSERGWVQHRSTTSISRDLASGRAVRAHVRVRCRCGAVLMPDGGAGMLVAVSLCSSAVAVHDVPLRRDAYY